jgi:hypothetical protein
MKKWDRSIVQVRRGGYSFLNSLHPAIGILTAMIRSQFSVLRSAF